MLRGVADLHGYTICASDGDIGRVGKVYFDDKAWGIRYLVVDTGDWLRDRQVLVSPYSVERVDASPRRRLDAVRELVAVAGARRREQVEQELGAPSRPRDGELHDVWRQLRGLGCAALRELCVGCMRRMHGSFVAG